MEWGDDDGGGFGDFFEGLECMMRYHCEVSGWFRCLGMVGVWVEN